MVELCPFFGGAYNVEDAMMPSKIRKQI